MAYRIDPADIVQVMRPVLGERFPVGTGLAETAAQVLRGYQPHREERSVFLARLKDRIFSGIYEYLGSAMLLQLEDGRVRRILLSDVDDLVDSCFGVLLLALPGSEVSLEELRQMAMGEGSLGAMRALLVRYSDSLPEMEQATLRRILLENGLSPDLLP